jgi:sugar phosphate isomerase/epimerase
MMNENRPLIDRRQFAMSVAAGAAAFAAPWPRYAVAGESQRYKFCAFIKFLQSLDYEELAEKIAEAGFDGVEATCRQKESYIAPERAADELPRFKDALAKHGLEITILTTDVLRADEPHAESMLRAAANSGIERYRLGFYRYDLKQPILPQLAALQPVIRDIAAMNRELGIAAVYQNHSGADFVGATIWDLHSLINNYPVEEIGCVFDIRHAAVEGGEAWPVYFDLMKPHLGAISVKDYRWNGLKSQHVPLGEGRVSRRFFTMLRQTNFRGPVSLHVEYLPKADAQQNMVALARDFATLRKWLEPGSE